MPIDYKKLTARAIAEQSPPSAYRLAKIMGVSEAAVSRWLNGVRVPSGPHLMKLLELAKLVGKIVAGVLLSATLAGVGLMAQDAHTVMRSTLDRSIPYTPFIETILRWLAGRFRPCADLA